MAGNISSPLVASSASDPHRSRLDAKSRPKFSHPCRSASVGKVVSRIVLGRAGASAIPVAGWAVGIRHAYAMIIWYGWDGSVSHSIIAGAHERLRLRSRSRLRFLTPLQSSIVEEKTFIAVRMAEALLGAHGTRSRTEFPADTVPTCQRERDHFNEILDSTLY